jgi:prolyl-tRNA synthetase
MEGKKLTPEELEAELKKLNIEYVLHKHQASFNMEEMKQNVQLKHAPYIKNLFSKDKKTGACYLVSAHIDTKIERAWYKKVGTNYNNCRMADAQALEEILGVQGGSVTPFGLINDHGKKVANFVLDQTLLNHEWFAFHPLKNDSTIELKRDDFFKFIESIGRKYTALNLSEVEEKVEKKEEKPKEEVKENKDTSNETKLSLSAKKYDNFSEWYQEVITKGELVEYYEISGCFILRPYAYGIWETIQKYCDSKFVDVRIIPLL